MTKNKKAAEAPKWPGAKEWPLDKIKRYDKNPRRHPPEQIELLAKLFLKFGPDQPIVVDENAVILKGHGRLDGAYLAKMTTFPVVQRFGMSEADKHALRISDNQVQLLSSWDDGLMQAVLTQLKYEEYPMELLGFGDAQLIQFVSGLGGGSNPGAEWTGMPEFDQQDKTAFRSIIVHFKDQKALNKFLKVTNMKVTPNTRYLWYPEIEIERLADKRYSAAGTSAAVK